MDRKCWKMVNGEMIEIPPIKELCKTLEAKFLEQEKENERLLEENKKLKEEVWKDEEVARLKNGYEEMKQDLLRGFSITQKENEAIKEWKKNHKCKYRGLKIGSSQHYEFSPTHIGIFGTIKCSCGESFTFQEP